MTRSFPQSILRDLLQDLLQFLIQFLQEQGQVRPVEQTIRQKMMSFHLEDEDEVMMRLLQSVLQDLLQFLLRDLIQFLRE